MVEVGYDMLVGADGVNSRVRKSLEENVPDFTVRQREVIPSNRERYQTYFTGPRLLLC